MSLQPGQMLSHYRVAEKIGEGGMGEVYRAEDTKLGRSVALKVLPAEFVRDETRLARFSREAQILASLNHPNIATIHGLEEADGVTALALELVEGETLAERIARGPLSMNEAAPIALQIAEALEAAHEKGIIHRDLKPANVKFSADGRVKVLDFGLAKAMDHHDSHVDMTQSPTLAVQTTQAGVILGTASYMSPEQAAGNMADRRADIWALGVVLVEMLTGRRPFQGESVSYVLAAVLKDEPDWGSLPATIPTRIKRLLRRCMQKDPKQRLQAIGDARIVLSEYLADPDSFVGQDDGHGHSGSDPAGSMAGSRLAWGTAAALFLALALALWWIFTTTSGLRPEAGSGTDPLPTLRFTIPAPDGHLIIHQDRNSLALSPDGLTLLFTAAIPPASPLDDDDKSQVPEFGIWSRPLNGIGSTLVPGTEGHLQPTISPDGQWLGMTDRVGVPKRIRVEGGEPTTLYDASEFPAFFGMTWSGNDSIVIAGMRGGLKRIPAAGGPAEEITRLDDELVEVSHRLPHALPGGEVILFISIRHVASPYADLTHLEALTLSTGERKRLAAGVQDVRYSPTGHLILARDGRLFSTPFDVESVEITGPEVLLLDGIRQSTSCIDSMDDTGAVQLTLAGGDLLAYLHGSICADIEMALVWVDRQGKEEIIDVPTNGKFSNRVSPDGKLLLLTNHHSGNSGVWIHDLERMTTRRQTFSGIPFFAIWGPGPDRLTYAGIREGKYGIFSKLIDSGPDEIEVLPTASQQVQYPSSWSADGQFLAFVKDDDIWILSRDGKLEPFVRTRFREWRPDFSPDGRRIAYTSDESGRDEVYIRSYPDQGRAVQISTRGGMSPVWSRDGHEIFYRTSDFQHFSVRINEDGDGLYASDPVKLFEGLYISSASEGSRTWDVAPDGRFFLSKPSSQSSTENILGELYPDHIRLIQNWAEDLP